MSLKDSVVSQFKRPRGLIGQLVGLIMANRASNVERNRWMLEKVELKSDDYVLEIGYGPGIALEVALKGIDEGMLVGIDHSETMFQQASKRIASHIASGKAKLLIGDIQTCPAFDMKFDHIYSANVVKFWRDPVAVYGHLKSLLKPGGDVVTLLMPRNKGASYEDSDKAGKEIMKWLQQAGFSEIDMEVKDFASSTAACIVARV